MMKSASYIIDFSSDEDPSGTIEANSESQFDGLDEDDLSIEVTDLIEHPVDEFRLQPPPRRTTDLGFLFRLLR